MRRLILLLPLVLMLACATDDDFTPTDPGGPSIPTIGGTYSSSTMWRFTLTGPTPQDFTCAGGVTIANQVGLNFSGTFFLSDPSCGNIAGVVAGGSFTTGGAVMFELIVEGASDPNFLIAAFACTYVSGDRVVTGTLMNNQLEVQATTVMQCSDGTYTLATRVSGTR